MQPEQIQPAQRQALDNLLKHAQGDTGQSRRVADFLLAWWNAGDAARSTSPPRGGDDASVEDMVTVFPLAARARSYPDVAGLYPAVRGRGACMAAGTDH